LIGYIRPSLIFIGRLRRRIILGVRLRIILDSQ